MIYDDLKKCNITELELLIDKLREKLSCANDRIVMLEAEADVCFMNFCEAQEEVEILRNKKGIAISLFGKLLSEVYKARANLPASIFDEVLGIESKFFENFPDWDGLPF